jgi:hypothetical protein
VLDAFLARVVPSGEQRLRFGALAVSLQDRSRTCGISLKCLAVPSASAIRLRLLSAVRIVGDKRYLAEALTRQSGRVEHYLIMPPKPFKEATCQLLMRSSWGWRHSFANFTNSTLPIHSVEKAFFRVVDSHKNIAVSMVPIYQNSRCTGRQALLNENGVWHSNGHIASPHVC